jgi:hypothetical protein
MDNRIELLLIKDKLQRNIQRLQMIYMRISQLMMNTFDLEMVEHHQKTMGYLNQIIASLQSGVHRSEEP